MNKACERAVQHITLDETVSGPWLYPGQMCAGVRSRDDGTGSLLATGAGDN